MCVRGAIIQDESDRIGFVPVGNVAMTTAGKLPSKYVIHAVGPRMGEGDEDSKLKNAVLSSLMLASEKGLGAYHCLPSVQVFSAFPRTGVRRY